MSLKEKIHFIHANGFPSNAYKNLFKNLEHHKDIKNFNLVDLKYLKIKNWTTFQIDFINSLNANEKIIGLGHSIGGNIILRSCIRSPEYFSKIILLDPTLFIPRTILMWKLALNLNVHNYFHPWVKATLKRKMHYKNYNEIYESYRRKEVFRKIDDINLSIYIKSLTRTNNDGTVHIIYPKELEYQMYKTGLLADLYIWNNIQNLNTPTLIIRSKLSNAFLSSAADKISRLNQNIKIIEIDDYTHLFPLEIPKLTAKYISKFLNKN